MEGNRLVFALKDEHGNDGTLALELPNKISVFEVDPRDAPDQGTGPALYKEWKLSGRAGGSGAFAPGAAAGHTLTLSARQGQFLHQRQRLRLLDAGDAGAQGELFHVRRPHARAVSQDPSRFKPLWAIPQRAIRTQPRCAQRYGR